jgi:hypothetical protein
MEEFLKNKILFWFIKQKIKGYIEYNFNECLLFTKPDINNNNDLIKFDRQFSICKKMVDENIIFNEENN